MEDKSSNTIFDRLMDIMAFLAGTLLLCFAFLVAISATTRYLNLGSPLWVLQYTEYALLWITFAGGAWLLKHEGHISIDSLFVHLPQGVQKKMSVITSAIGGLVSAAVFIAGGLYTIELYQRGILDVKATNAPKYLIFCIIPIGGLLMTIQFVRRTIQYAKS